MARSEFLIPFIFLLAAVFYTLLGINTWRKRPAPGVVSFTFVMFFISIWSFLYGLRIISTNLEAKLVALDIEYIGILGMPVYLFFFALEYTGRSHWITVKVRGIVWAIPLIILLLLWTNPIHHLMWDDETITTIGTLKLLTVKFGVGFWLQTIFTFSMIAIAAIILMMDFLQSPRTLRLQISLVIFCVLFSLVGIAMYAFGVSPIKPLNLTPLFFLPASIGLAWVILQGRPLTILSLEHLSILKNMKDSVVVLDNQQRILYINPETEYLFNRSEDEAIGQPFEQVSGDFAKILHPYLTESEYRAEIEINKRGQAKTYEALISTVSAAKGQGISNTIITLRDFTEHKEKEEELSRRSSIMSAISRAAEKFLKATDWEQNISSVLMDLGLSAEVSRIFIVKNFHGENGSVFASLKYEWTATGIEPQIDNPGFQNVAVDQKGLPRWHTIVESGSLIYGVVNKLPEQERDFFSKLGSLSIVIVPIFVDEQWWGSIIFDECSREREWTGLELDAFQAAASILGSAEARIRTERKLHRRQLAMRLLQDIVAASLQAPSLREMAETVADRLAELIGADGCYLTLWEEDNKRTIPFAAYGTQKKKYSEINVEPGAHTFTFSVLELNQTLIVEDVANTIYASPAIVSTFPSKSMLILPLVVADKKLGALLVSFENYHHFDQEEIQICEQAAPLLALAMEKLQTMEEVTRRAETSETLRKAALNVAEKLELDQAIPRILEQLNQVVPYDSAAIQLLEGNELVIIGGHGWKDMKSVIGLRFPVPGDNPNSNVVMTGKTLNLSEPWKSYKDFKEPPHDHIRSWLGVPLITNDNIIGLLSIDSSEPDDFNEEDVQVASEFARQVAVALENARIFQETQNQALTDSLTGVYNRRGVLEIGQIEFTRADLLQRQFAAIMLDLDYFKKINDTYGHSAGDLCLHEFAQRCKSCIREIDYIGRYGGEEILILLPDTNIKSGKIIAERLKFAVSKKPVQVADKEIHITASLGVACKDENTTNLEMLIARADQAMYIAKHNGRDRVAISR